MARAVLAAWASMLRGFMVAGCNCITSDDMPALMPPLAAAIDLPTASVEAEQVMCHLLSQLFGSHQLSQSAMTRATLLMR